VSGEYEEERNSCAYKSVKGHCIGIFESRMTDGVMTVAMIQEPGLMSYNVVEAAVQEKVGYEVVIRWFVKAREWRRR
jgi:hypothetical protein